MTEQYGGDPARVVLVGHSYGSDLALSTAVSAETETPDCLVQGDGRPEAAVGLSGFQVMLDAASAPGPPIFMAGGADDLVSVMGPASLEALKAAGFKAEFQEFPATSHESIVDPEAIPPRSTSSSRPSSRPGPTDGVTSDKGRGQPGRGLAKD